MVGYQLDEDSNWGLDIDYLRKRLQARILTSQYL